MYALPSFRDTVFDSLFTNIAFGNAQNFGKIFIGEAVLLCLCKNVLCRNAALCGNESIFFFNKLLHLFNEVSLYLCKLKQLLNSCALAESLVHNELTLRCRNVEHIKELLLGLAVEILCKAKTVSSLFKASDSLLESLLVGLAYAHYLTNSAHLCSKLILCLLELFKSPASKLDHDIIPVGIIFIKSSVLSAGDIFKSKTRCKHSGNKSYGEARCL